MAKYVCDFTTVNNIANKIQDLVESMDNTADNYETTITSNLSGWNGEAKEKFLISNQEQVATIKTNLNSTLNMAEFILQSSQAIEELEIELSSLNI